MTAVRIWETDCFLGVCEGVVTLEAVRVSDEIWRGEEQDRGMRS